MTEPQDVLWQATVCRLLLYYLNAPIAEGCSLRGVLPAPGAVRIAVRAGEGETGRTFLYEIPDGKIAPAFIPGILRTILVRPQYYSSDDIGELMGMTLIRLRPQEITPDPAPEQARALTVLHALNDCGDEEDPFLIGFHLRGDCLMRLYVQRTDHTGVIGVDIRLTNTPAALIASLPALITEAHYQKPAQDDPHCDLLVDLTAW